MNAEHGKIGRQAQQAIAALLSEPTHEEAARKAGVSLAALQRWLADPAFKEAYRQAAQQAFHGAICKLELAPGQAVSTLIQRLNSEKEGDEIRAAALLLAHAFRAKELLDYERKIAELESIIAELQADEQHEKTTGSGPSSRKGTGRGQAKT